MKEILPLSKPCIERCFFYSPTRPQGDRIGTSKLKRSLSTQKLEKPSMSLKLTYYGQNDSVNCTPAVFLTGDPGTDQQTLTSAGYLGGVIVAIIPSTATLTAPLAFQPSYEPAFGSIGNIVPCDASQAANAYGITSATLGGCVPFATLLNGPGEFAGAIGPSG